MNDVGKYILGKAIGIHEERGTMPGSGVLARDYRAWIEAHPREWSAIQRLSYEDVDAYYAPYEAKPSRKPWPRWWLSVPPVVAGVAALTLSLLEMHATALCVAALCVLSVDIRQRVLRAMGPMDLR